MTDSWRHVSHRPQWEPAMLPVDAEGNTQPGFVCVHQMENGNGQCFANTFDDGFMDDHCCVVNNPRLEREEA